MWSAFLIFSTACLKHVASSGTVTFFSFRMAYASISASSLLNSSSKRTHSSILTIELRYV